MKLFTLLFVLVASLSGCQKDKLISSPDSDQKSKPVTSVNSYQKSRPTIYLDYFEVKFDTRFLCDRYQEKSGAACIRTPEEMVGELKRRIETAISRVPACKAVTFTDEPVSEKNFEEFEAGLGLSFAVEIDKGDIDYRKSEWRLIHNKSIVAEIAEGQLTDPVKAATDFCAAAYGQGRALLYRVVEIHADEILKVPYRRPQDKRFEPVPIVLFGQHQKMALVCEDSYKAPIIEGGVIACP